MGQTYRSCNIPRKQAGIDTSAQADGRRAHALGMPISANPHRWGQHRIDAWEQGWKAAEQEKNSQRETKKEPWQHRNHAYQT